MEETIRRNASPVRSDLPDKERLGSSSSLNSSTSDDSLRYRSKHRFHLFSFSFIHQNFKYSARSLVNGNVIPGFQLSQVVYVKDFSPLTEAL